MFEGWFGKPVAPKKEEKGTAGKQRDVERSWAEGASPLAAEDPDKPIDMPGVTGGTVADAWEERTRQHQDWRKDKMGTTDPGSGISQGGGRSGVGE